MEVSGTMGYFCMLSIWWFFATCSVIGFGLCVLLFMQKGKKCHSTKMETEQMIAHLLAEIRSSQEEMKEDLLARLEANIGTNQEIHSIRSELEQTIQHRIENVMMRVNYVTQSPERYDRKN
jgi:hypothetical protein